MGWRQRHWRQQHRGYERHKGRKQVSELVNSSNSREGRAPPTGAAAQLRGRLRKEAEGAPDRAYPCWMCGPCLQPHHPERTRSCLDIGPRFHPAMAKRCRRRGQAGLSVLIWGWQKPGAAAATDFPSVGVPRALRMSRWVGAGPSQDRADT